MINNKKIIVCLPAYNAAKTLEKTYAEIPKDIVDAIILVDDASKDETVKIANELGIDHVIIHHKNKGYGGNQKTCYTSALALGADIVIMLHPDYQYDPKLIPHIAALIANDVYPVVLGSRILGKNAMQNGMPMYKYYFNRLLTSIQNKMLRQNLSEYHTGYRAFSSNVLKSINLSANSDNFVFDNQMISQIIYKGFVVGEISCPAKYFPEASSIGFSRSLVYGFGVLQTSALFALNKMNIVKSKIFQ